MKLLEILPGLLIITAFILITICLFFKQLKAHRRQVLIKEVKAKMQKVATDKMCKEIWEDLMYIKSLESDNEVNGLIDTHCKKLKATKY